MNRRRMSQKDCKDMLEHWTKFHTFNEKSSYIEILQFPKIMKELNR